MKRLALLSIVVVALNVGDGFAETQSACAEDAQTAVCKKDFPVMGMGETAVHGDHGSMSEMSGSSGQTVTDHGRMNTGGSVSEDDLNRLQMKINGTEKKPDHAH